MTVLLFVVPNLLDWLPNTKNTIRDKLKMPPRRYEEYLTQNKPVAMAPVPSGDNLLAAVYEMVAISLYTHKHIGLINLCPYDMVTYPLILVTIQRIIHGLNALSLCISLNREKNQSTMKIGIFTALFHDRSIEDAFKTISAAGIQAVELGGGAYPGSRHLDDLGGVKKLIKDSGARKELGALAKKYNLEIDSISVHGNPLHPNDEIAEDHHDAFANAVLLVEALHKDGIISEPVVNGFSGCPGDHARAKNPSWVTCPWPDEYRDVLDWQWKKKVIPYWKKQNSFLKDHGVKFAIEAHPGFVVYNPETLLTLRKAAGDHIGCNFDPSHFWWQSIDPIAAVRSLGAAGAIFHVHAKDTRIDPYNSGINGNLDTKSYGDILNRSWVFRSVGYGHDSYWWKDFVSNLRMIGYDHILSIEHEDGLMSTTEGLKKAMETLSASVLAEKPGEMFWAKE